MAGGEDANPDRPETGRLAMLPRARAKGLGWAGKKGVVGYAGQVGKDCQPHGAHSGIRCTQSGQVSAKAAYAR